MSKVDHELLDQLTTWMQEGGFTRLTYKRGKSAVTLRLPGSAAPAPKPKQLRPINSPGLGAFMPGHPLADQPYVQPGSAVDAGDIVGLLAIGPVLLPVKAPCSGLIRSVIRRQGEVVGYDDQLFDIEPVED